MKSTSSAARFATSCSACRSPTATGSSSARHPRRCAPPDSCRSAPTSRCSCIPKPAKSMRSLAPNARQSAGYHGFAFHASPDVTLEEDLAAPRSDDQRDGADGRRHADRSRGAGDAIWTAKILRHVSPAFVEDPVRILRLARLAARFTDFTVAPETERADGDDGRQRRGRRAGARARLEGAVARPDGEPPVADVRGAARLRRARPDPARRSTGCGVSRSRPSTTRRSIPACT